MCFFDADKVPEADGGEANETKVQGVQVFPVLERSVNRSGATRYDATRQRQMEHNPIDARFPLVQVEYVRQTDLPICARLEDATRRRRLLPYLSFQAVDVNLAQNPSEERDDLFQKQVEEENSTCSERDRCIRLVRLRRKFRSKCSTRFEENILGMYHYRNNQKIHRE